MGEDNFYAGTLSDALVANTEVEDWRFSLEETQTMSIGRDIKGLAGPYNPPTRKKGLSADVYIRWKNGRVSESFVEPHHFDSLEGMIQKWRENSREDPDAARILSPSPYSNVLVCDDKAASLMSSHDPAYPFETMEIYGRLKAMATEHIDASTTVSQSNVTLRSSRGLSVSYPTTSCVSFCSADQKVMEGDSSIKLISLEQCDFFVEKVARLYNINKNRVQVPSDRPIDVIFDSGALRQLTEKFLLVNLEGGKVAQNNSAFAYEDFHARRQAFAPQVNLVLDSLADFEVGSHPVDSEGIPGQRLYLVKDGRLQTPILDVKWGGKLKMPHTGMGYAYFEVEKAASLQEMVESVEDGLLIETLLGMHTQVSVTGNYALPTVLALQIRNGKLVGGTKVSVCGNLFEELKSENTRFAYDSWKPRDLAMRVHKKVTWMQD